MKTYFFITILSFLFLISCKDNTAETHVDATENTSTLIEQKALDMSEILLGKAIDTLIGSEVSCAGSVEIPPQSKISIHPRMNAFVSEIQGYTGTSVRKGEVLCVLEHPDLIQMQIDLLSALAKNQFLEKEKVRMSDLKSRNAVSDRDWDLFQKEYSENAILIQGLKEELTIVGVSTEQLIQTQKVQKRVSITSPSSAVITQVFANAGKFVQAQETLMELMDTTHLHVELMVYPQDVRWVKEGQKVFFQQAGGGTWEEAEVYLVGKNVDPMRKTVSVHAHLKEIKGKKAPSLRSGVYVKARILTQEIEGRVLPSAAFYDENGKWFVFEQKGKEFLPKEVQLLRQGESWMCAEGLSLDASYVVEGTHLLKAYLQADE